MYDPHLHLFVDDAEVDASRNVTPTIGRPERRSHDPIMTADQPWEGRGVGMDLSILKDDAPAGSACGTAASTTTVPPAIR